MQLVFENSWKAEIKLKMSKCKYFQKQNQIFRSFSIWERDFSYETESKSYYRIGTNN